MNTINAESLAAVALSVRNFWRARTAKGGARHLYKAYKSEK